MNDSIQSRVAELFDVLTDVREGKYKRTMMSNEEGSAGKSKLVDTNATKGKVLVRDGVIVFDKVPIVTPNSDILVSYKRPFRTLHPLIPLSDQRPFFQSKHRHELFNFWSQRLW